MCLDLSRDAKKQTALEDIICYKRILIDHTSIIWQAAGKSFTGIIKRIQCEGKIQVEHQFVYFCTNNLVLDGTECTDKLGYSYSWVLDDHVESIIVDGVDIMIPTESTTFMTPYREVKVKLGETYTSELIREGNVINIGLHTFANYKDARINGIGIIVKCIIPKGAEYYEGWFDGCKSYASSQLKYPEVITK